MYVGRALKEWNGSPLKALLSFLYRATPARLAHTVLRSINPTFSLGAAGLFFTSDGTLLVLRHVYRHRYPWGLPSGFLKTGETPEDGALRELKEETGLNALVEGVVGLHYVNARHLEITVKGVLASVGPLRLSHEIFEAAYVRPDALPQDMPPEQKEMVRRAAAGGAIKTLSR